MALPVSVLLIGDLLQAIGTGLLTPIGMNITLAVSPREELDMVMGIMAAMTILGPVREQRSGQRAATQLTDAHEGKLPAV
ncbi:hypothetical protein [Brevibacterium sp. RIT 803]|uniref:hypothetical protein n=1 Tax=Brevibacterium sp. RIT 803 TaxID=2810210 RepID=UPI00194DF1B4|nr:hypothetical protein [Brevibacterium sp. RIT 803]MBM6590609.1 hypothetical protein [Brevibacterium sp. RIT 803]